MASSSEKDENIKVFISYSHDNETHKLWVKELATKLISDGIKIILDQWELIPGDQLTMFMEESVHDSDFVLLICTPNYKMKSDKRQGGVGYEGDIMTGEVMNTQNQRKFIPILRGREWDESAPTWLVGKYYIDLRGNPYSQDQYNDLKSTLLGTREKAPSQQPHVEENDNKEDTNKNSHTIKNEFEPIQIIGIIVDQVGNPRNDGTRGSALYKIPFRLSETPPKAWSDLFVENWNHPPRFTTMHRPGIASIVEDKVILNGTTIEEVRDYHRDTLILVIDETNKTYKEFIDKEEKERKLKQEKLENHYKKVKDISDQINFYK